MFKRPNLNLVIDEVLLALPRIIDNPVQLYLVAHEDNSWGVYGGLYLNAPANISVILATRERKLLRKYVKEALDALENKLNDKRRSGGPRRICDSQVKGSESTSRDDD